MDDEHDHITVELTRLMLPLDDVRGLVGEPSAYELDFGMRHGLLDPTSVVTTSPLVDPPPDHDRTVALWLFVVLASLWARSASLDDPLRAVENAWADFGHPAEIRAFVPTAPADPAHPPSADPEENRARMMAAWGAWVEDQTRRWSTEPERLPRFVHAFDTWSLDAAGRTLTVEWIGSPYHRDVQLAVDEDDREIRLTASFAVRPSRPSTDGRRVGHMRSARTYIASAELARPLAERRVVDTELPDEGQASRRRPGAWPFRLAIWNTVLEFERAELLSFDHDGRDTVVFTIESRPEDFDAIRAAVHEQYGPGIEIRREEFRPDEGII